MGIAYQTSGDDSNSTRKASYYVIYADEWNAVLRARRMKSPYAGEVDRRIAVRLVSGRRNDRQKASH
jgi:hypothetical protein